MNQFCRGVLGGLITISSLWIGGFLFHLWPPFPREDAWYHGPRFFTIFSIGLAIAYFGMWIALLWTPKQKDAK